MASAGNPDIPPPYSAAPSGHPHMIGVVGQQPTTTIIHTNMTPVIPVVIASPMGPKPANVTCKSCNLEIQTNVVTKATMRTHLFALLLCIFGCWPCVCIPYCVNSCNNADHYCPNCSAYIGTYIH